LGKRVGEGERKRKREREREKEIGKDWEGEREIDGKSEEDSVRKEGEWERVKKREGEIGKEREGEKEIERGIEREREREGGEERQRHTFFQVNVKTKCPEITDSSITSTFHYAPLE
jgi:hypothetical protein